MGINGLVESPLLYGDKLLDFYPFESVDFHHILYALRNLPGVVGINEINELKKKIAVASEGDSLFLQLGNCAEGFSEASYNYISNQVTLINKMQDLLEERLNVPTIPVARLAGQFGKPRTSKYENIADKNILSYHGDLINSLCPKERMPDPYNLLIAYAYSKKLYHYLNQCIADTTTNNNHIYTSHEALLVPYEEAFTKNFDGENYNLSAHFLWVGYRSIYQLSPQVEYAKKIANPVGLKLGPKIPPQMLCDLILAINPKNELGKIVVICRFGKNDIQALLPHYIKEVRKNKLKVLWACDPMHGNTKLLNNRKVRFIEDIICEINYAMNIYKTYDIKTPGIHLEAIGQDILECIDNETEFDKLLHCPYTSLMDPRLNGLQTNQVISGYIEQVKALNLETIQ